MRCGWVRNQLSAFLDGELDEKTGVKVKAHLKDCPSCRREGEILSRSWEMLSEWKDIEASPNFRTSFWRRVDEEERAKRKPFLYPQLFPRWALATAVILLVFVSFYVSRRPGRERSLPTLAKEEFEVIDKRDWEIDSIDSKEMINEFDDFTEKEMGQLFQAVATPRMREQAELVLAREGEIHLEEVMEEISGLEFGDEIIFEAMVTGEMVKEVQDMNLEEGGVFL